MIYVYTSRSPKRGFSLIEMAVVLVVIGIIIAGVTAGGQLLRSMRLKSMVSQVQDYRAALLNFSSVYQGIPGDLVNAASFFDGDISALPAPSEGTCDYSGISSINGNGDETIDPETESSLALLHLSLAEMTKKTYCGVWSGSYDIGVNIVSADIDKGAMMRIGCCADSDYTRGADFKNHFAFSTISPLNDGERAGVLTPAEALALDIKNDDGVPDTGFIASSGSFDGSGYSSTGCYTGERETSAYITKDDDATGYQDKTGCIMMFKYD